MPEASPSECKESQLLMLDENAVCEGCGRFGAYHVGERIMCPECYTGCGSCCPEFGKDDLWEFDE